MHLQQSFWVLSQHHIDSSYLSLRLGWSQLINMMDSVDTWQGGGQDWQQHTCLQVKYGCSNQTVSWHTVEALCCIQGILEMETLNFCMYSSFNSAAGTFDPQPQ